MEILVANCRVIIALCLLFWAAITDLRHRLIPNWAVIGLLLLFLLPNALLAEWVAIGEGCATAAGVLLVGMVLFRMGWMGGGDVKLMTALALWAGPGGLPQFAFLTSLAGGALCFAYMGRALILKWAGRADVSLRRIELPYGVAIAFGGAPLILATLG